MGLRRSLFSVLCETGLVTQSAESRAKTFDFFRFSLAFGVVLGSNIWHDRAIDDLKENFRGSLWFRVPMSVMRRMHVPCLASRGYCSSKPTLLFLVSPS